MLAKGPGVYLISMTTPSSQPMAEKHNHSCVLFQWRGCLEVISRKESGDTAGLKSTSGQSCLPGRGTKKTGNRIVQINPRHAVLKEP